MIIEQVLEGGQYVKHYSDASLMIRQEETGWHYDEAIDVLPCQYTYTETDEPIPEEVETDG